FATARCDRLRAADPRRPSGRLPRKGGAMKPRWLFAFVLACVEAGCHPADAAAPYPFSFDTVKVADGVYAFIEAPGKAIVSGNTTVVIGEDAALVVDTGHHPE